MKPYQSALRALSISAAGMKEAIMAVAERVARRVQIAKLQLQAVDAEARLQQAYESLGHCLYTAHTAKSPDAWRVDEALPLCENIRAEQHTLQGIRDRLTSRYDDVLSGPLIRLQEDLQNGGGAMERVTITPASPADGRSLSAVVMPEGVRIVLVRRVDALLLPTGDLVLKAGDHVTILGDRSAVPVALQSLRG
ncbi:MAG TPA: TrkA C-terminal domain-containing protein [Nitrospirales bacterium]